MNTLAAKPTEAQVRALEAAHKELFYFLVQANKIWLEMSKAFAYLPNTDKRKQVLLSYGNKLIATLVPWQLRQARFEKAGIPAVDPKAKDLFLNRANAPKLDAIVATMAKPGSLNGGIGFIPLLIWGVIAIAGLFTASEVVDEFNTTAEEKSDLMKATTDSCAELNLSKEQCAKILSDTQEQASAPGALSNLTSAIPMVVLAFLALQFFKTSKQ